MNAIKAVLVGDSGVGKSTIFQQFEAGTFNETTTATIGGAFARVTARSSNRVPVPIGLWDTAGQERYKSIIPIYFEKAHYVLLVYDISVRATFDSLPQWLRLCQEKVPDSTKFILIGNKCDLALDRAVETEQAMSFGQSIQAVFVIETSAKTGEGLEALLEGMADEAVRMRFWGVELSDEVSTEIEGCPPEPAKCC